MNKIDNFFKKKVEEASVEARPEAWQKLEANLSKKNNSLIWLRVAAAILLAGLFIASIIWLQKGETVQQLSEVKKEVPVAPSTDSTELIKEPVPIPRLKTPGLKKEKNSRKQKPQMKGHETVPLLPSTDHEEEIASVVKEEMKIESEEIIPQKILVASVDKPIVIEYTLELLPKKQTDVVADATEKKNNLQKALEFAREAKNSDSPLGGLRQAKNDLFALNFKKDKQKKQ